jgi:hypothetical protein
MNAYVSLFFDIIILAALGATMWRAHHLSRQFNQMQSDRKAFEQLIQALNLASSRAEAAIRIMKETALEAGGALNEKTSKGRALSEELEIMIQAGDSLAERLQDLAGKSRVAATSSEVPAHEQAPTAPRTKAEKELAEALKARQSS